MSAGQGEFPIEGRPPIIVRGRRIYWAGDFWDIHDDSIDEFCDKLRSAHYYALSHAPSEDGEPA